MNNSNTNIDINSLLLDDEYIKWKGTPKKIFRFSPYSFFVIPFMMLWFGFVIFWVITALSSGAPFFFAFFGIFIGIMGATAVFGAFFKNIYILKNTTYIITNKRVLLLKHTKIEIITSDNKSPLSIMYHKDGTASIIFESTKKTHYSSRSNYQSYSYLSMENIENVNHVQNLINELE